MSDYNRTTRECSVNQLRPELFRAVRKYFQEHKLGDLEAETLLCYETTSKKKSVSKLSSWLNNSLDTTIYTGVLFTSEWLIWVRSGDRSGVQLSSADLKQISVKVYYSLLTREAGVEIAGHVEGSKGMMSGVLAMETISIAEKFCDEVNQVIINVNPPSPNKWPKWWGG